MLITELHTTDFYIKLRAALSCDDTLYPAQRCRLYSKGVRRYEEAYQKASNKVPLTLMLRPFKFMYTMSRCRKIAERVASRRVERLL